MKKLLILLCLVLACCLALAACDEGDLDDSPPPDTDVNEEQVSTPHTHEWSNWTQSIAPTCVAKGKETRNCACGASETQDVAIDPTAHSLEWQSDTGDHWQKCSHNGCTKQTEKCEHEYDEDYNCIACRRYNSDWLHFLLLGDSCAVSGYSGSPATLFIPSTCMGLPVIAIDDEAFYDCESLTSVVIPESVTEIGDEAFSGCSGLSSITIPANVNCIAGSAFRNCPGLESIMVDVGNTVYHGAGNCLIETAEKMLVTGCKNSVIPMDSSVTSIGDYAFDGCTGLTSLTIPASVTFIDDFAIRNCTGLEKITVKKGNTVYHSAGNCLIETASGTLIWGCKNSVIPTNGSVKSIGYGAFSNCDLTAVTIPASVTSIGTCAFKGCSRLTTLSFEANSQLESVKNYAFENCTELSGIQLPGGLLSLGVGAFNGCPNLIQVQNGVSYVDKWVVGWDASASSVSFRSDTAGIASRAFYNCTTLVDVTIPASVTGIGEQAFYGCSNLLSVIFGPNSQLESIGGWAFCDCSNLVSITIPAGVTNIGDSAFFDCIGLTSITIPASVTRIGENAFSCCTSLTSVTIPAGVTTIDWGAFFFCNSLTDVYFGGSETQWKGISIDSFNDPLYTANKHYNSN